MLLIIVTLVATLQLLVCDRSLIDVSQNPKESVLWQDKLKSLIQEGRRGDHVTETWAALLEAKENRITVLERDVNLMEKELLLQQQQREQQWRTVEHSGRATPIRTGTPSQQQMTGSTSSAAQMATTTAPPLPQHYRNSPVTNGQAINMTNREGVSDVIVGLAIPYSFVGC